MPSLTVKISSLMIRKKVGMILGNPFINDNRVLREAGVLAKAGYKVRLFATADEGLPAFEKTNNFEVIRLPIKNYSSFRLRIYPYYTEYFKAYKKLVAEKADIYHCHDLDTLLLGYLVIKRNKAKIVYDSHEYWPSRTVFTKTFFDHIKGLIRNPIFRFMEKYLIKRVDAVISANDTSGLALSKHYKIAQPVSIYNYHSLENQKSSNILRNRLGLEDKKIMLYLGGINKGRGILELVSSLKYLPDKFNLVFLGKGRYKEFALNLAKKLGVKDRVHFPNAVPPKEVVKWASSADIGVSPIQNISMSYYFSSPNKVFEYLMAGLPIAVSNFPEMKRIMSRHHVGEMFNPDDPKSIAKAVNKILTNEDYSKKLRANALRAAREEYNWEKESKKLINLYSKL
jgi:glycosyltransferase involved in cell wall biosynthesis